jgi:ATP-dependent helicase HrpB
VPTALPIDDLLPELLAVLAAHASAVLVAAPGAGKSTRVPTALMRASWLGGKRIVMLEPRRLAARAVAGHMAANLGEAVGETVGYRVRLDSKVSARTKVEVVTEGIFTRRIQSDPSLENIGLVIFDEFHERSLDTDLGLALTLDVQRGLRPDLKVLVMSATLDDQALAGFIGGEQPAPILRSVHRPFPVTTTYAPSVPQARLHDAMATTIRRALDESPGSVLAFLPGEGEIRRTQEALENGSLPRDVAVMPLFAALSLEDQQRAITPAQNGQRKVVLATTIAETSLTIQGVGIVVDSGVKRVPRFDPRRGMTELETVRVSRAAAEQRRGRAGRLGPGVCYRLWAEPEDRALAAFDEPEILQADLAGLVLDLAAWGVADPAALPWLTQPPSGAFAQAVALLKKLSALDPAGRITPEGKAMAELPLHPRLAHMVHRAGERGQGNLACNLAALLSERDIMTSRDPDIRSRLSLLRGDGRGQVSRSRLSRVKAAVRQIQRASGGDDKNWNAEDTGSVLALAYPDRVAQRRGDGRYRFAGGGGGIVDPSEALAAQDFLAVADLDGSARDARIYLAAPLSVAEIEDIFADEIVDVEEVAWDSREGAVVARRQRRFGALVLEDRPLQKPDPAQVAAAMADGVRQLGLSALPWSDAAQNLRQRVALLATHFPNDEWPDWSEDALLASLDEWLVPMLEGVRRREQLTQLDLHEILRNQLPWAMQTKLDELAPTHIAVPSGSRITVDYSTEGGPSLQVKLQEVFGLTDAPKVAGERVPVTLHLLSPAQRPLAVTRDLASFWVNVYPQVRGEMRSRYPRHIWPEDPLTATAVRRTLQKPPRPR